MYGITCITLIYTIHCSKLDNKITFRITAANMCTQTHSNRSEQRVPDCAASIDRYVAIIDQQVQQLHVDGKLKCIHSQL